MRILYDYQGFIQGIGGVSRYHCELIKNLPENGIDPFIPMIFSDNLYLEGLNIDHKYFLRKWQHPLRDNLYKWLDQKICLKKIQEGNYDIFHPTFLNPYYIGNTGNKPIISTMHDLNHEKFPQFDTENVKKKRAKVIEASNHIIAISQQTKNDLIDYYDIDDRKISVIYHGIDQDIYTTSASRLLNKPYLLYVGSRNTYKNFKTFLKAFSLLKDDIDLVFTGLPFSNEEQSLIQKYNITTKIHQYFATNEQMNQLMNQAVAFIYPSIGEGFGMPILEAYRCGTPCIISDILCFHEIGDNAAIYFDPTSAESIAETISNTINNDNLLISLKELGYKRMKKFPWSRTAESTAKVYRMFDK